MNFGIKTAQFEAVLNKAIGYAADESCRRILFLRMNMQLIQIDTDHGISFGMNVDPIGSVENDIGDRFQIDCCSEHAALLMIRMITTDFRTSGSRELIVLSHRCFSSI